MSPAIHGCSPGQATLAPDQKPGCTALAYTGELDPSSGDLLREGPDALDTQAEVLRSGDEATQRLVEARLAMGGVVPP